MQLTHRCNQAPESCTVTLQQEHMSREAQLSRDLEVFHHCLGKPAEASRK